MPDEIYEIEANLRNFISRELKVIRKDLAKTDTRVKKSFGEMTTESKKFGEVTKASMQRVVSIAGPTALAVGGVTTAFFALKRAGGDVINNNKKFEKSLSVLGAIVKPTTQELELMADAARRLGETTIFTASQAADAFLEMGKLGLETNQILAATPGALDLAAISAVSMAESSSLMVETLAQFNLEADESSRVVDVMAKAFNISALDISKFRESMKFAGVIAGSTGESIEMTTSALAALAQRGLAGSLAGTGLRFTMSQLAQESSKASVALQRAGSTASTFVEKLEDLSKLGLTPGQIMEMFGERAGNVANILLHNVDALKQFNTELEDANGTAKEMAEESLDNLEGDFTRLKSKWEELTLILGTGFNPALRKGTQLLGDYFRGTGLAIKLITGQSTIATEQLKNLIEQEKDVNKLRAKRAEILRDLTAATQEYLRLSQPGAVDPFGTGLPQAKRDLENLKKQRDLLNAAIQGTGAVVSPTGDVETGGAGGAGDPRLRAFLKTQAENDELQAQLDAAEEAEQFRLERMDGLYEEYWNRRGREYEIALEQSKALTAEEKKHSEERIALIQREGQVKSLVLNAIGDLTINAIALTGALADEERKAALVIQVVGSAVATINAAVAASQAIKLAIEDSTSVPEAVAKSIAAGAAVVALGATIVSSINSQKFARGTDFAGGGPALVGEEGPEIVNLPKGSQVVPNNRLPSGVTDNRSLQLQIIMQPGTSVDETALEAMVQLEERMGVMLEKANEDGYIRWDRLGVSTVG